MRTRERRPPREGDPQAEAGKHVEGSPVRREWRRRVLGKGAAPVKSQVGIIEHQKLQAVSLVVGTFREEYSKK